MNKSHIDMFINIQFSESMSFKLGIGEKKERKRERNMNKRLLSKD